MEFELIFKDEFEKCCNTQTDINQHLPTLYEYAKKCNHITEMGVRDGQSTRAFLYANPEKLLCYDLYIDSKVNDLFDLAKTNNKKYDYIEK